MLQKANRWRFCGRKWSLRKLSLGLIGLRVTACLASSHKIEILSGVGVSTDGIGSAEAFHFFLTGNVIGSKLTATTE